MYDWIPLIRLGPFAFNEPVENFVEEGRLVKWQDDIDNIGWEAYMPPDGSLRVSVEIESGNIISVNCDEKCYLKGVNLIGLKFDEFKSLLGEEPEPNPDIMDLDDGPQTVYEFPDSDAQVWVQDGIVVTVICGTITDDDLDC